MRTLAIAVFTCLLGAHAWATPLTLATPGVVGTLDGKVGNSNPSTELTIAQQILDLVGPSAVGPVSCVKCYRTSTVLDYSATLLNPEQHSGLVVPAAYKYAMAKYDGQNGGYVLFYLPTFGHTLPRYPANFWTMNPAKWEISHFTTFDVLAPPPPQVPDGGSTAWVLGLALGAVACLRRRFAVGKLYDSRSQPFEH